MEAQHRSGPVQIAAAVFTRLVADDEIAVNPMAGMADPFVLDAPVPVVSDDWLAKLLAACSANTLVDRRDMAILRLSRGRHLDALRSHT